MGAITQQRLRLSLSLNRHPLRDLPAPAMACVVNKICIQKPRTSARGLVLGSTVYYSRRGLSLRSVS